MFLCDFVHNLSEYFPVNLSHFVTETAKNTHFVTFYFEMKICHILSCFVTSAHPWNLFAHIILVTESRRLHMADVLAHPLGPVPWAHANCDGTLRRTNKAALAREMEKTLPQ